ncbi:MAG: hypothetical protein CMD20_05455 [Flavobacteriales bacterium]|nr:hypothetical protein [Flavobacteriales bacterium]
MKSLLIASSFLVISIASLFTPSEINVNFNAPSSITSGESFIMDIEIDKGDISDFAKLQLSLPEGFSAELFEGKEGTFTFYDQKVKLIWISLPAEPKFHVKLKISCDTSLVGDYNFKGKISYVLEGERKNKELISPTFKVTPKSKPTSPTIVSTKTEAENNTSVSSASTTSQLSCSRSFDAKKIGPGETFLVTLKVKKSNVSGVGKIIENIPDGFTAQEGENNGAIFSQKGSQVKFLWMTLPSDNEFSVSYKIMVDENLDGNKVIDGKMSYLDGDMTKNTLIDGTSIEITNVQQDIQTAGIEENSEDETSATTKNETNELTEDETLATTIEKKETQESETVENTIASNEKENSTENESKEINQNSVQTEDERTTKKVVSNNTIASNEEKKSTQVVTKPEENNTSSEEENTTTTQEDNSVDNAIANNEKNNTPQNETSSSIDNTNSIEKEKTTQTESKNVAMSATSETTSNHKVNYRVQICALRKKTETNYFTKNHNVKEKIYLNMHEGWHKYTVGDFKEYMSARDHRSTAKSNYKINGSFVTAYNDGSRITVQEALMITKDKWIAP